MKLVNILLIEGRKEDLEKTLKQIEEENIKLNQS
jgi:hypothetical protein